MTTPPPLPPPSRDDLADQSDAEQRDRMLERLGDTAEPVTFDRLPDAMREPDSK